VADFYEDYGSGVGYSGNNQHAGLTSAVQYLQEAVPEQPADVGDF
jgi:hypothetical protein